MGLLFVIFLVFLDLVKCYNLDLETRTIHSGDTRSMFGYSVALHQDQGSYWYDVFGGFFLFFIYFFVSFFKINKVHRNNVLK